MAQQWVQVLNILYYVMPPVVCCTHQSPPLVQDNIHTRRRSCQQFKENCCPLPQGLVRHWRNSRHTFWPPFLWLRNIRSKYFSVSVFLFFYEFPAVTWSDDDTVVWYDNSDFMLADTDSYWSTKTSASVPSAESVQKSWPVLSVRRRHSPSDAHRLRSDSPLAGLHFLCCCLHGEEDTIAAYQLARCSCRLIRDVYLINLHWYCLTSQYSWC